MKDRYGNEWVNDLADALVKGVAELPDRNSPEGQPEIMLVTADELRMIVAAALAAAPKFEAVDVTDEVCDRVFRAYLDHGMQNSFIDIPENGRAMIAAVRAELGPALGLVEMREPTPDDCRKMHSGYYEETARLRQPEIGCGFSPGQLGGAMFTAVAKWLKGDL